MCREVFDRSESVVVTAIPSGSGIKVDDEIGATHRILVMFDYHQSISFFFESVERFQQSEVIPGMQTDRRFIQDVEHTAEIRSELGSQPDPLRLAATQRAGGSTERQVFQPNPLHEEKPLLDFGQNRIGKALSLPGEFATGWLFTRCFHRVPGYLFPDLAT